MWDLPGPGLEPVSPALAGGFLTMAPPGKPKSVHSFYNTTQPPKEMFHNFQSLKYSKVHSKSLYIYLYIYILYMYIYRYIYICMYTYSYVYRNKCIYMKKDFIILVDLWKSSISKLLSETKILERGDGERVRRRDHLPPHRYIRNTSTRGTAPIEHLLNADRRPQTSQKARKKIFLKFSTIKCPCSPREVLKISLCLLLKY